MILYTGIHDLQYKLRSTDSSSGIKSINTNINFYLSLLFFKKAKSWLGEALTKVNEADS